jgi:uncharacterized membrane protein YcaP (DUF421 family)
MASMLARAINGSAPMLPTIAGGFVLVFLHKALSKLSCRFHCIGLLIKGDPDLIVSNGSMIEEKLKSNDLSGNDLMEGTRLNGKVAEIGKVNAAYFERNGGISVIPKKLLFSGSMTAFRAS